jgi:hypothetical protein
MKKASRIDFLCAALAVAAFAGFFVILISRVPRADLAIVVLIVAALVAYDIWRQIFAKRRRS